ncbi:MAG: hypothetical protein ACIAXF_04470 [Phycisphaerales bacterium JB063]
MQKPFRIMTLGVVALSTTVATADPPEFTELNGDPIDTRTYRAWASNYRQFAQYCAEMEGGFLVVPNYDRRLPSSRGLTRSQAVDELTETWRESNGTFSQSRMREPQAEEAYAYAYMLPDAEVGTYGYLHSVEIVEILGPEEMLVKDLWLIDVEQVAAQYDRDYERARDNDARNIRTQLNALYEQRLALKERQEDEEVYEQTHRLVGYETLGLSVGERWAGPDRDEGFQVALARWEVPPEPEPEEGEDRPRRRRGDDDPRLVMVNPEPLLRRPLDEQGMVRLIDARGYTVTRFVEAMRSIRERFRDRDDAEARLMGLLLPPTPEEVD